LAFVLLEHCILSAFLSIVSVNYNDRHCSCSWLTNSSNKSVLSFLVFLVKNSNTATTSLSNRHWNAITPLLKTCHFYCFPFNSFSLLSKSIYPDCFLWFPTVPKIPSPFEKTVLVCCLNKTIIISLPILIPNIRWSKAFPLFWSGRKIYKYVQWPFPRKSQIFKCFVKNCF